MSKKAQELQTQVVEDQDDAETIAKKTLTGDLRDFILDRLKHEQNGQPWNKRKEHEQRAVIFEVEAAVKHAVNKAVDIIAADGRKVLRGSLAKVAVKDGIKAEIVLSQSDPMRHEFIDHQGQTVLISLATPEDFEGQRAPAKISPDQGDILTPDTEEG